MYEKYTTEAFVVTQKNLKESDRIFLFFTKEFGLIWVIATGVRHPVSKLRAVLEVGNKIKTTLIKGREFWRVVEAEQDAIDIIKSKESKVSFLHILKTVQRMVHGEEKNLRLWQALDVCFETLHNIDKSEIHLLECVALTRMLDALGYGRTEKEWGISLTSDIDSALLEEVKIRKITIIKLINESLKQSQLNN